jgi:Tol biopolymer transport system component
MLTASGAKLLDFGLAKPAAPLGNAATLTAASPNSPMTEQGTIVGTFQYMSPEQVEGKELDGRSDIFSLGAVLYEMITGKRAFEGNTVASTVASILAAEPKPLSATQPMAPAALEHVVRTCLAKDPDERWRNAHDVKVELQWIGEGAPGPATSFAPKSRWRERLAWALAVAFAAVALTLAATYYSTRPVPVAPLMASLVPPAGVFPDTSGRNGPPQISPDGSRLAFVGCNTAAASSSMAGSKSCSIWLRSLHLTDAHQVAGTSGGYFPFWSPDGRYIAFFADGKLKRVAADGGPVEIVCDADDGRGGSWGSPGTIIFAATRGSPIFRVPADGGSPEAITRAGRPSSLSDFGSHRWPHLLPDGEHFLYLNSLNGSCNDLNEMHFASLDGKQDVSLMRTCSNGVFANGRLVYWRDGNLVAQPFDPRHGVLSGTAIPIAEHVALDSLFSFAEFSISANGKLIYVVGEGVVGNRLVWYDRTGRMVGTLGGTDNYKNVAISPDGSRIAINVQNTNGYEMQVLDARGTKIRMRSESEYADFPSWSADGRQIYFTSKKINGPYDIFAKAADGSGEERPVITFDKAQFGAAFLAASPDGTYLAYVTPDPARKLDIYAVPLTGDRTPHPFLHSPGNQSAPAFSPDGKWLAYESNQSGRNEVYITSFPAGGAQHEVSTSGGERPVWRRDGKEIFYRERLTLMAVEVNTNGGAIELGTPKALFELAVRNLSGRWYDVSSDGHFLTNTSPPTTQAQNFELIVNWPTELRQ